MRAPLDVVVGSEWDTKKCGKITVVEYTSCNDVCVEFNSTGFKKNTSAKHIGSGNVKDPTFPQIFSVGYFGVGKHKAFDLGKPTKAYNCWRDMLRRCYDESSRHRWPTYKSVSVCKQWHNFQEFAEWYELNHPKHESKERYELDKDVLNQSWRIRRMLEVIEGNEHPTQVLLDQLRKTKDNKEFLATLHEA